MNDASGDDVDADGDQGDDMDGQGDIDGEDMDGDD